MCSATSHRILTLLVVLLGVATAQADEKAHLRAEGQPALERLIAETGGVGNRPTDPGDAALIDAVAAQKDAWASGLYWHTDLDTAKGEAQRDDKPILSLRLLGRLDEELSCANSRFFRVALYPDPRVRDLLRERFVLHWQSERPVPIITIDFGDGRTLTRTITGNSIHYVLLPDGTPIDALPGLYAPGVFAGELESLASLADRLQALPAEERMATLRTLLAGAIRRAELQTGMVSIEPDPTTGRGGTPGAVAAAVWTASKLVIERPMLRQVAPDRVRLAVEPVNVDAATLRGYASAYADDAKLSRDALRVFLSKMPPSVAADPAARAAAAFEASMANDTALNELRLRPAVRRILLETGPDLASINARVYAEVFLTPASDPWLGLGGDGTFLALDPAAASRSR